jgi:hypothetical protein
MGVEIRGLMEGVRNGVLSRLPKLGDSIRLSVCGLDTEAATHFPALPENDFQREFTNT